SRPARELDLVRAGDVLLAARTRSRSPRGAHEEEHTMSDPIQREAEGAAATVDFYGHPVTIPDPDDWPIDLMRAFESGQLIGFVEQLVGSATFRKVQKQFRRDHGKAMTVADLRPFGEAMAKELGFESQGE